RFAFELGLSPELNVLGVEDDRLFHHALDEVLDLADVRSMNGLAARLSVERWQKAVRDVADRARDNDVAPDALIAMGRDSADALLAFFPRPQRGDQRGALLKAIDAARGGIDLRIDTTKGTRDYLDTLREASHQLRRDDSEWSWWMSLAK